MDFRCAILSPLNATTTATNNRILQDYMHGESSTYFSSDRPIPGENTCVDVSIEFLKALCEGLPPRGLMLKKGVHVMLLRNMDPPNDMRNGTRLIVVKVIEGNVLRATMVGNQSKFALIPASNLSLTTRLSHSNGPEGNFIRLAFSITINKSQSQTLRRAGVDLLMKPVFSHGQ